MYTNALNTTRDPQHDPLPQHQHRRQQSRSNSLSSSSVVTVKRSKSFRDDPPPPSAKPTPPPSTRRQSVAHVAQDSIGSIREGIGNLNRWSQSTASSKSSAKEKDSRQGSSFARRLSISASPSRSFTSLHGSSAHNSSPPRKSATNPRRSPAASPHRRSRPHSPAHDPSRTVTTLPPISTLPLLPPTVYDPSSANSSAANTPSTSGLFTPSTYNAAASTDYFTTKPRNPPQNSNRPPSRNRQVQSSLGSPPVGVLESEARYKASTTIRPATASSRESAKPGSTAPRERRAGSRDVDSHQRTRSRSDASSRLDDGSTNTPPRNRERREKDKKTMLSRALQKANTAVLLDNAQNFEGAMEAYGDACKLLQQVMIRSSGEEDRRKLDAIRVTYTNRIEELRRLDPAYQSAAGKSLPARPMSNESLSGESQSIVLSGPEEDDADAAVIETATMTRILNDKSITVEPEPKPQNQSPGLPLRQAPGLRESVFTSAIREVESTIPSSRFLLQPPPGKLGQNLERNSALESPMDRSYMPPPLSPRRPSSPNPQARKEVLDEPNQQQTLLQPERHPAPNHTRAASSESMSWLDTIDESGGSSCSSSVHSLSPGAGLRRKHIRTGSGDTEAEFDAALDAAVEAAYDDGLEPYEDEDDEVEQPLQMDIATRLRNVELAKERVREVEREEAISAARYRYRETQLRSEGLPHVRESAEFNFQGDEAEEEERMLDEMTKEYMLDGFDFDLQTKSSLPRQSDSSGFSNGTWNSSMSSNRTTAGTSLSTVAEVNHPARFSVKPPSHLPPPVPPPTGALPAISDSSSSKTQTVADASFARPPSMSGNIASSVRNRRLSGQNAKQLKIETSLPPVPPPPQTEVPSVVTDKETRPEIPPIPKSAGAALIGSQTLADTTFKVPGLPASVSQTSGLSAPSPIPPIPSPADSFTVSPATPLLTQVISNDSTLVPSSPKYASKPPAAGIRKNKSSLSLKARTLSMSSPDGSDGSVGTPLSTTFSFTTRKQSNGAQNLPTPSVPTFNVTDGLPTGGMHLFESDIHSPYSPGSPNTMAVNAPIPLEPCPDSYLLRPFWLMRCFYQTIAHPRGGYISTKLFIPRDVWRVKGVKLKNLEEKMANCDLLTAALQRLCEVDTLDADAVYEEMNTFESIMDQVQAQLAKKLGTEVGVNGISSLFKDATMVGNGAANADGQSGAQGSHNSNETIPKSAVAQSKSYLSSWRKLRSKNSAVGLSSMATGKGAGGEVPKDSLTMPTLPMTTLPNIRFAKRDVASVVFDGPNAGYMQSLAKLFDAVQILDQIARQVEDPGLRHSSSTHVGLELSTRHAAEFFGFYICRFVLTDVTMMLDKFIKRGSEWVLV
ncbi:hypothetical protein BU16DRAFT_378776 [Lophium mytilinum]|uniref:MIT domain-containing protein n=1 Tax=Lophium mytilinum TaxID=390894 RepID=A0A6A6QSD0_9PEZI|nr:hypothetical protein BU16DRAFT_378776 [Lophium mytilinum]